MGEDGARSVIFFFLAQNVFPFLLLGFVFQHTTKGLGAFQLPWLDSKLVTQVKKIYVDFSKEKKKVTRI